MSTSTSPPTENEELQEYQTLFSNQDDNGTSTHDSFTAPLLWWDVKEHMNQQQYAVLGHTPGEREGQIKPVLLNTNAPWSAFLCGSQGSGKSHALSCMLENCLLSSGRVGKNPNPLAGLVFHYDRTQSTDVCEAAYLCSSVATRVLVSPSNYGRMKARYEEMARKQKGKVDVQKLRLLPNKHLDTGRMKTLMATGNGGELPLYMHHLMRILRTQATANDGNAVFNYQAFKSELLDTGVLTDKQTGPLNIRIDLLESFLNLQKNPGQDYIVGTPGSLTIIDLTDPVVDSDTACVLFDICLSIFVSQTTCSKIVALDEAHNYMSEGENAAVKAFTEKLLKTIREQRHQATRVVIATQEPGINTQLIDLCNITMVHRCNSPAWFAVLKKHVGALFVRGSGDGNPDDERLTDKELYKKIVTLKVGESLLFCTTAAVDVVDGEVVTMDATLRKFKTRKRITADGGVTKLADGGEK
ncbi:hypothetical protein M011DRAFT_514023 [Sporormia fimetaria CBS 119925]|uniref:P-loop containing nucleoside triphosphate hydrolase protein n=1 Tax=Sporormia fimetaria CBS 119925 TaxID=1340428 RepID=A0A6A6UWI5_9PLEO|nr:hypothetical protein M011DRAFT_514023 [Sporormia fimetaria CBS 119925]